MDSDSTSGGQAQPVAEWEPYGEGESVVVDGTRWYVGPSLPFVPGIFESVFPTRWKPVRMTRGRDHESLANPAIATLCEFHDDVGSAKASAAGSWERARLQATQEAALGRRVLGSQELINVDGYDIRDLADEHEKVTRYAAGVYEMTGGRHGYFLVNEAVLSRLPDPCRKDPVEGFAWYEEDAEWSMLALGDPSLFTDSEVETAKGIAERTYPDLYAILNGRPADAEELELARRGFSRDKADWHVLDIGTPGADGMTPVTARLSAFWGVIGDVEPDFEAERAFMVPNALIPTGDEALFAELDLSRFDPVDGPVLRAAPAFGM